MPVWKRQRLVAISRAAADGRTELRSRPDIRMEALGSGSDYTAFLHHLGIASVNMGYGGEDQGGGQYHSVYDDFYWYTHFQDTDFIYGRALAQTAGTMMMRMADADVIPFQFGDLADTVRTYVTGVKKLTDTMRAEIKERNTEIADGVYKALEDPKKKRVAPQVETLPPYLNFAPLDQAMDDLTTAATEYDKAFTANALKAPPALNLQLIQSERVFLDSAGLPNRPWFQNMMYAPGFYTGYGVKTLPAAREAIEQKQWKGADEQIARTAAAVEREAELLKNATRMISNK
jgi:N-acetylated-alpha-linked acidic dipeptidase